MCVSGGTSQQGRGRLHNIPFTHRTKRTSTESLLWLEVGSTGRDGSRLSLKKIQDCPPNMGAWGREIGLFNPKGIRSKRFVGARAIRAAGEKRGRAGCLATGAKGLPSPCWFPQPLRSGREGAACNPQGQTRGCETLRAGLGGSQGLALQRDDRTAPQFFGQGAAVLDLLVAVGL